MHLKAKLLTALLIVASFSVLLARMVEPAEAQTLTQYYSEDFTSIEGWNTTGDATQNTTIFRSASTSLKVDVTSNNAVYAATAFDYADFLDFIMTIYIYIPSGETATTRHLFAIYFTNATGDDYILFQVTYDGAASRMYYLYAHEDGQHYAVTDTKGHSLMTVDTWHRLKIGYSSEYGRLFFTIDYSLRRNEPYIVNNTNNPTRITKIDIGQFNAVAGWSGVQFYDDLLFTAFEPTESFEASNTKQVIFWFGIMENRTSFRGPAHIGLAAAVGGYYQMGQNYTDEMTNHYNNGCRHFIIEAERDTTGVDYFLMSSYLNKWATFNLDALFSPMVMFRMFEYEDKAIMALGIDDEHPLSWGPTVEQFDDQISWVLETLPLTNGIAYFTWTNVSPELQNHVLHETQELFWDVDESSYFPWICEPDPFVAASGLALGWNNNFSYTFTFGTNQLTAVVSSVNASAGDFYFSSAGLSVLSITVNGTATENYAQLADGAYVYLLDLPSAQLWNVQINFEMQPYLPVMFILGIIGLCSMVGGGFFAAHKIKRGEYYEGGRMGLIYVSVGLGLFLAWVFMEVV